MSVGKLVALVFDLLWAYLAHDSFEVVNVAIVEFLDQHSRQTIFLNAANRNGVLVRLLLWGMLRISELVEATWESVDGQVLQVCGKGRKYRVIPIVDQETRAYLNT